MTVRGLSPAERAIIGTVPPLLSLDPTYERMRAGEMPGSVVIDTDPPSARPVMILHPPTWGGATFHGRETIDRWVDEALTLLAEARTWRQIGGDARPPVLVRADLPTLAVMEGLGIDRVDLLRRIDAGVPGKDNGWPGSWRLEAPVPALLRHGGRNANGRLVERRPGEPWMRGRTLDGLTIEAVGLSERLAVIVDTRVGSTQRYEIRTADMFPASVVAAAIGRDVSRITEHPAIASMGGTVVDHATTRTSTRFGVSIPWSPPAPLSTEGADVLEQHLRTLRARREPVVTAICEALGVAR